MNNIKDIINEEFNGLLFECNVSTIKNRYKRKQKNKFLLFSSVVLLGVFLASNVILDKDNNTFGKNKAFTFTTYAAEVENSSTTDEFKIHKHTILDNKYLVLPKFKIETTKHIQEKKTYYSFYFNENPVIGITGENIKSVKFISEITSLRYGEYDKSSSCVSITYDNEFPDNNYVTWLIPESYTYWMIKQDESTYEFSFLDLPTDTITIKAIFTDGSVKVKKLKLSFDSQGNMVIYCEKDL